MNYILSRLLPLRMLGYEHRKSLSWIQKEIYPRPLQTSKMECFATIVNGFQLLLTLTKPLTIVAKRSILDGYRSPGYGSAFISVSPICFLPDSYHHWFPFIYKLNKKSKWFTWNHEFNLTINIKSNAMMSIGKSLLQSAEVIHNAKAMLITAGAGVGVDSGLPDFHGPEGFWKAYPPYREKGLVLPDVVSRYS